MIFFSAATDSLGDEERRFTEDFFGAFLFIGKKTRLGTPQSGLV